MPTGMPPFCMTESGKSARLRHEAEAVSPPFDVEKTTEMTAGNQPAMIGGFSQRRKTGGVGKLGIDIVNESDFRIGRLQFTDMQHITPQ